MSLVRNEDDASRAVKALDELIEAALDKRASDIHIEAREQLYRLRLRVDGVMVDQGVMPLPVGLPVVSRLKVLGGLDIAEKRLPQDGMFAFMSKRRGRISLRVSTFPGMKGEKVVLRLQLPGRLSTLEGLGVPAPAAATLRALVQRPGGLILVTGPTGAGKTSTLYALLREIDPRARNVCTLEDPVEVELAEVTQGQVNRRAGFDFASGLRALLRQDPDVILVGEMRDHETAAIAVQASLTGHLVLSTLHTSSVPATITRLLDLGLEPYVVASALSAVVAQRLVRTLCPACGGALPRARFAGELGTVGFEIEGERLPAALGCEACLMTGYSGRTGLFELAQVDDPLGALIRQRAGAQEVRDWLRERAVPTLRRAGVPLVQAGKTTVAELLRMT